MTRVEVEVLINIRYFKIDVRLVAHVFLYCYERDFIMSPSDDKQADSIDAFNTTSRYFDDVLNFINVYFDSMVIRYTL